VEFLILPKSKNIEATVFIGYKWCAGWYQCYYFSSSIKFYCNTCNTRRTAQALSRRNKTLLASSQTPTRNSSGDEIANMNFFYNNIIHILQYIICCWIFNTKQAVTPPVGVAAWYYCTPLQPYLQLQSKLLSHSAWIWPSNRGVPHLNTRTGGDPLRISP